MSNYALKSMMIMNKTNKIAISIAISIGSIYYDNSDLIKVILGTHRRRRGCRRQI